MYKYCMPNEYTSVGKPTKVIPLMKLFVLTGQNGKKPITKLALPLELGCCAHFTWQPKKMQLE